MDAEQIAKLAHLARININEDIAGDVANNITDILKLVDQLQAVNTDDVAPMSHPMDAVQRLRADTVNEPDQREALQSTAPAVEEGLFLVPKVID